MVNPTTSTVTYSETEERALEQIDLSFGRAMSNRPANWIDCERNVDAACLVVEDNPQLAKRLLHVTFREFPMADTKTIRSSTIGIEYIDEVEVHRKISTIFSTLKNYESALIHASHAVSFEGYRTKELELLASAYTTKGVCLYTMNDHKGIEEYEIAANLLLTALGRDDISYSLKCSISIDSGRFRDAFQSVYDQLRSFMNNLDNSSDISELREEYGNEPIIPARVYKELCATGFVDKEGLREVFRESLGHYYRLYLTWKAIARKAQDLDTDSLIPTEGEILGHNL